MTNTSKQNDFLNRVTSGENVFLTGKAGTGKSFIVKKAIEELSKLGKKVIAVAPTGIAANNIDGQTIHSMFKLQPFGVLNFDVCNFVNKGSRQVLQKAETIIIDEVSMLRPDVLDAMHWTLKKNGLDGLDKRQVVFVGDMKQLPPILDDNTRSVLYQNYDGDTFDFAEVFKKINPVIIELDEILRQSNQDFIEALNFVRDGAKHEYFRQFVHTQPNGIILAPHNSTVDRYNREGLDKQEGKLFTFKAVISGNVKPQDFNFEEEIQVKDGCKIMYLVNSKNNPLRNGTIGVFRARKQDKKYKYFIQVGSVEYALNEIELTKKQYVFNQDTDELELQDIGTIIQYPIKLAYALSIHKSQGLTFDEVTVDLRRPCFQKGQMYVALSRVTKPEGLRIII